MIFSKGFQNLLSTKKKVETQKASIRQLWRLKSLKFLQVSTRQNT